MDSQSYKTQSAKPANIERKWYIIDAEDQIVGRMCTQIAHILRGKNRPYYTPHIDCGDNVIVINAEKIRFSGNKMAAKEYKSFSGYPGGLKLTKANELMAKRPTAIVEKAVKGMLPKTKLGNAMFKKLFVYAGNEHPHDAQKPETLEI